MNIFKQFNISLGPTPSPATADGDFLVVNLREKEIFQKQVALYSKYGTVQQLNLLEHSDKVKKALSVTPVQFLDKGGFGSAYLARDICRRQYTIKMISPRFGDKEYKEEVFAKEVTREVYVLSNARDHPNFVKFVSQGYIADEFGHQHAVILTERLYNFHKLIDAPLKLEVIRKLVREIGSAITFLHDRKLVHHDIKANNIMQTVEIDPELNQLEIAEKLMGSTFKLIDFGLVRRHQRPTEKYFRAGTTILEAPEKQNKESEYEVYLAEAFTFGVLLLTCWFGRTAITFYLNNISKEDLEENQSPFQIICNDLKYTLPTVPKEFNAIEHLLDQERDRWTVQKAMKEFE